MLTLVIPDCFTASMTVAKAPKGTFSSARIADSLANAGGNLINVDGVVAEKYPLILVNRDDDALFGDFFDRAGLGNADLYAGLQNGRGHHKDDQQNQYDVDQRRDVDIGECDLSAAIGGSKGHQRLTSAAACGCILSMALRTSREKSSPRAANTRIELPIKLWARRAGGRAPNRPAVVIRA